MIDEAGKHKLKCDPFFSNWVKLGRQIYEHMGMQAPQDDLEMLRGVKWRMFLDAVLAKAVVDKHWQPQVCRPSH